MERTQRDRTLRTTKTTLRVIEALRSLDGARVTELAEELDLAPSTVHGHLATLEGCEYVTKEGDVYALGLTFLGLGEYVRTRKRAYEIAKSSARRLAEESDCRAVFMTEEHGRGVYVHTFSGKYAVWTFSTVGMTVPLHVTAAGKAILSQLPEQTVEDVIERRGLEPETEHSITDRDELFEELEAIRERGFSFNREEQLVGVKAVGAPVMGAHERVIGSFSAASPANRMEGDWFENELPGIVLGIANEFELEYSMS